VDWFPWGDEAFKKAKQENKPVLVSIGYSACHWCHVMEKESFEDGGTAGIMNEYFVNIKVDREERPDLDHIYMDAVQAMTGSGGWPLNVFLTPDGKPFYGGTYFPPEKFHNRPSWKDVLNGVYKAFNERRSEIDSQAESLTRHLIESNAFGLQNPSEEEKKALYSQASIDTVFENVMKNADKVWGGFGRAPKFPQTFVIQFLLRYRSVTGNEEALAQALLSIDKMIRGGIYDQVGGGFARYSTDTEWLAPHFEKMLYDNALLLVVLCEAYQLTKKNRYREVIHETMEFITRELMSPGSAFYSALDADSEGKEGKFYVWDKKEVIAILGENEDTAVFCEYYDISSEGNWEGKNILWVKIPAEDFAEKKGMGIGALKNILEKGKSLLLSARAKRARPATDDKIILGWNALMNAACSKAFEVTGEEKYKELAIANMRFLLKYFSGGQPGEMFHVWKDNVAKYPAFLDDYAFLIDALCRLYEITADLQWLEKARGFTEFVIEHFSEKGTGFFYFSADYQEDLIARKKEIYDGATPSGNAVMASNLYRLFFWFGNRDWYRRAEKMLDAPGKVIVAYPASFGNWACLLLQFISGTNEIVIVGKESEKLLKELSAIYLPHKVLMSAGQADETYPLLAGKGKKNNTLIYLCKEFQCRRPVSSIKALLEQLDA
jgi:uncharacterized protein YyaL (SSP411 family)